MCDVYQVKYIEKNIERDGVIKAIENEEDVEIAVQLDSMEIVKRSDNFWEALLSVRRELELKDIFDNCASDEYSSIAEQQNYYDEWCNSIGG